MEAINGVKREVCDGEGEQRAECVLRGGASVMLRQQ